MFCEYYVDGDGRIRGVPVNNAARDLAIGVDLQIAQIATMRCAGSFRRLFHALLYCIRLVRLSYSIASFP